MDNGMSVDSHTKDWAYAIFGRGDAETEHCHEDWSSGKDWLLSGSHGEDVFEASWIPRRQFVCDICAKLVIHWSAESNTTCKWEAGKGWLAPGQGFGSALKVAAGVGQATRGSWSDGEGNAVWNQMFLFTSFELNPQYCLTHDSSYIGTVQGSICTVAVRSFTSHNLVAKHSSNALTSCCGRKWGEGKAQSACTGELISYLIMTRMAQKYCEATLMSRGDGFWPWFRPLFCRVSFRFVSTCTVCNHPH